MKHSAEVRRKNLGKQFALVHIDSRVVFSWHRPGETLPKLVEYMGETYILTQAAVDEAQKNQRAPLEVFKAEAHIPVERVIGPKYELSNLTWTNPKGGKEVVMHDRWATMKEKMVSLGKWGAAVAAGGLGAYYMVDNLKGLF